MIAALLIALANPDLDAFDEANLALTGCGFAAHREAAAADTSLDRFNSKLGEKCAGEIAEMRRSIIRLDTGRGKSRAAATDRADQVVRKFHAFFGEGYARRHADEAKLKVLIDAIEQEEKRDAQ